MSLPFEPLDTVASVATPERVRFRYRIAGPATRGLAWAFDLLIRLAVGLAVAVLTVGLVGTQLGLQASGGLLMVAVFLLEWLYAVFFETIWSGRTPGKVVFSLRVVRLDGSPVRLQESLLRNLVRGADLFPAFAPAMISMVLDPRSRRLGDLVAGTVVVVEDRTRMLTRAPLDPPISEEERRTVLLAGAAVRLGRDEAQAIEELLRRSASLGPARTEELAAILAPGLTRRFGLRGPTAFRTLQLAWARAVGRDR